MDISKDRIKQIIREEIVDSLGKDTEEREQEWASVKAHLEKIHRLSRDICDEMQEPENVEEWIQEKVAVISAMLHSIQHYQEEEKVRTD